MCFYRKKNNIDVSQTLDRQGECVMCIAMRLKLQYAYSAVQDKYMTNIFRLFSISVGIGYFTHA